MSYTFSLPNITATTAEGKLWQMHSFLYQTVEQLNWALNAMESGGLTAAAADVRKEEKAASPEEKAVAEFNDIKSLIIKSADIVSAYYEKINARLVGEYVSISDFGTYSENTAAQIEANSRAIEQRYEDIQQILTDIENMEHTLVGVNASLKTGLLYYDDSGVPVYGLEIGQRTEVNGEEVFNRFARFTSDRLSFYDENGYEAAYISDSKLCIPNAEVTGTFTEGGFVDEIQEDGSIVTRWMGGGS